MVLLGASPEKLQRVRHSSSPSFPISSPLRCMTPSLLCLGPSAPGILGQVSGAWAI